MKYIFSTNIIRLKFLLILICVIISVSCQADNEAALQSDSTAKATINNTTKSLTSRQKLKSEDLESIKAVYEKYPNSETALQTYKSALISRGDWASLEKLLSNIPLDKLSDEDKINLGKTYVRLGRFNDAIQILKPVADGKGPELKSILANSYFQLGKYDESKAILDDNWDEFIKSKRANDVTTRGMIYFYEKDSEKAIETLEKALEIDANNISAANGLSRVYASQGETEKAEEYLAKVQKSFDEITAEETRKTTLVSKLYKLQEAYKAKRYQEVINLGKEILPEADTRNKPALMQYLFNSYKALGMTKEAQEIMAHAKQLQPNK